MAFWKWWHSDPAPAPRQIPSSEYIEDVLSVAKADPPRRPFCYVNIRANCPDAWTPYYSSAGSSSFEEEDVKAFTTPETAKKYLQQNEEVIPLRDAAELWACLNNPRRSKDGRGTNLFPPPYGLTVDYDPSGAGYLRYSKAQIQTLGPDGLSRGFTRAGELKGAEPERVRFPSCLICSEPSFVGITFHCIECGFSSEVHEKCRSGGSAFSAAALTSGGRSVRCPKCGATG
jgi:hypothetical protein